MKDVYHRHEKHQFRHSIACHMDLSNRVMWVWRQFILHPACTSLRIVGEWRLVMTRRYSFLSCLIVCGQTARRQFIIEMLFMLFMLLRVFIYLSIYLSQQYLPLKWPHFSTATVARAYCTVNYLLLHHHHHHHHHHEPLKFHNQRLADQFMN